MFCVPDFAKLTRRADSSARRCCETAGRETGRPLASSPTAMGPAESFSKMARRVGSARAASCASGCILLRQFQLTVRLRLPLRRCQPPSTDPRDRLLHLRDVRSVACALVEGEVFVDPHQAHALPAGG